ncbi:MAG: DUF4855 domain-containing protein [Oscillospiraceae bacterium]|nr:DUF4855 domain-containing protein [Oscillospiraceae bacterium]
MKTSRFLSKLLCASLAFPLCMTMFSVSPAAERAKGTNIALGKPYTIESLAANDHSYGDNEKGTKDQLTDGKYGVPNNFYGGPWAHFARGFGRVITVDLGDVCAVESVYTRFLQNQAYGIYCPIDLEISLSENGTDFMPAANAANPISTTAYGGTESNPQTLLAEYRIELEQTYRARYVRLTFDVSVNSFCDEIEVYGSTDPGDAAALSNFKTPEPDKGLPDRDSIGVHDIICFHYGYYPSDQKIACNSVESFLPFIGYRDVNGKYVDTMFDAVMFLIVQGLTESSDRKMTIDGGPSILSDWEMLLDNAFDEEYNLTALDKATAQLKETLSLPDSHKTAVYLAIPYPKISDNAFGDLDGDGVAEKLTTVDDCVKAITWYLDRIEEEWSKRDFQHIDLKGFFFFSEALENSRYDYERELAKRTVSLLHERDYQCVSIPFYQAGGFQDAEEYGFDASIMQANLSFNEQLQEDPEGMMEDFISTANKYGFGIQMELSHSLLSNVDLYASYYEQYLISASRSGLMNSVHAYYDGAGPGLFYECSRANKTSKMRWIYDATYKFTKATLDLSSPSLPEGEISLEMVNDGSYIDQELPLSGDWYYQYQIVEDAKHGYTRFLGGQTTFRYSCERGYTGEDSFTVRILANGRDMGTVTYKIHVRAAEQESSAPESSDEASLSAPSESAESKNNTGMIAGIVCTIAAVLTAVTVLIRRSSRRK